MTTKTELHWVALDYDVNNAAAEAIFGQVLTSDLGPDDALWIEPQGGEWALSHNTREISRHASQERAKRAAREYFDTL